MIAQNEEARLDALRRLNLLDTAPSEAFDRITRMASQLFGLPIAAVSLTDHDRQWFKSRIGVEHTSIPRDKAPCAEVAESSDFLVIPNMLDDPWYRDSLLARNGIRFYAGVPLTTREGHGLGSMCVLGTEPRQISASELTSLTDLAAMVMAQIELQHAFGRIDPLSGFPNRTQFMEDLDGHRQLVELRLRWGAIGTACSWLRRSGDAGDLGPSLEGLAPGGSILGGGHLMAAKVEEVADPVVGGQEALRLAG